MIRSATAIVAVAVAVVCALAACQRPAPRDPVPPHETLTIASKALGEDRPIHVSLPPGYDGVQRFDVVYMPDGGIDEDFPHIANTLNEMMARGEIPPVILVGIPNTVRRRDLTGPTTVDSDREVAPEIGRSAQFRSFVRDELFPAIAARYHVTDRRSVIGESLAGWWILETFFLDPDMFHGYVAMSPSLWWNDHGLVRHAREHLENWGDRQASLYLTRANETDIVPYADELAAVLAESAPPGLQWTYDPHDELEHHTIFRATKETGLRTVLAPGPSAAER